MNALELTKIYFPTATDKEAESVLWTCTGFPGFFLTSPTKTAEQCLEEQLQTISLKSQQNPQKACQIAADEMDEAMKRCSNYKRTHPCD